MKFISSLSTRVFAYLSLMFTLAGGTATIEAAVDLRAGLDFFTYSDSPFPALPFREQAKFEARGVRPIVVFNIEQLYTAVNDPANAGATIRLAPGVYMLSVNDPGGLPRPNRGRLELRETWLWRAPPVIVKRLSLTLLTCQ